MSGLSRLPLTMFCFFPPWMAELRRLEERRTQAEERWGVLIDSTIRERPSAEQGSPPRLPPPVSPAIR